MIETTYRCNNPQCGKIKGEANHWVAMRFAAAVGFTRLSPLDVLSGSFGCTHPATTRLPSLTVVSFEDCGPNDEHYCGPACAVKRFAEFLDVVRAASVALQHADAEGAPV